MGGDPRAAAVQAAFDHHAAHREVAWGSGAPTVAAADLLEKVHGAILHGPCELGEQAQGS